MISAEEHGATLARLMLLDEIDAETDPVRLSELRAELAGLDR